VLTRAVPEEQVAIFDQPTDWLTAGCWCRCRTRDRREMAWSWSWHLVVWMSMQASAWLKKPKKDLGHDKCRQFSPFRCIRSDLRPVARRCVPSGRRCCMYVLQFLRSWTDGFLKLLFWSGTVLDTRGASGAKWRCYVWWSWRWSTSKRACEQL